MTIVAVVQARMTSSRLPGKVLAELGGEPMLAHMLKRVRKSVRLDDVCVATTSNSADDAIAAECDALGVRVFRGDEHDVLGRILAAADMMGAETIVRLTGDCPMTDPELLDLAIAEFENSDFDYYTNSLVRTFPDGLDIEIFTRSALAQADAEAVDQYSREHVTPYMQTGYAGSREVGEFRVGELHADADFGHLRWTVDTDDDLRRVREMVDQLPNDYGWLDVVAMTTRRPELLSANFASAAHVDLQRVPVRDYDRFLEWIEHDEISVPAEFPKLPESRAEQGVWIEALLSRDDVGAWVASDDDGPIGLALGSVSEDEIALAAQVLREAPDKAPALHMILLLRRELSARWPGKRIVAKCSSLDSAQYRLLVAGGFGRTQVGRDHILLSIEPDKCRGGK